MKTREERETEKILQNANEEVIRKLEDENRQLQMRVEESMRNEKESVRKLVNFEGNFDLEGEKNQTSKVIEQLQEKLAKMDKEFEFLKSALEKKELENEHLKRENSEISMSSGTIKEF